MTKNPGSVGDSVNYTVCESILQLIPLPKVHPSVLMCYIFHQSACVRKPQFSGPQWRLITGHPSPPPPASLIPQSFLSSKVEVLSDKATQAVINLPALLYYIFPIIFLVVYSWLALKKDLYRRDGKGRCCCLEHRIDSIPCRASYFAPGWLEERDEFIQLFTSSWFNSSYTWAPRDQLPGRSGSQTRWWPGVPETFLIIRGSWNIFNHQGFLKHFNH